jgi:CheY-like chemotaxis protein
MSRQYALIVDDNVDAREILSIVMEQAGFEVELARNGLEALASVEKRIPDIVLLDLMMPGVNGFQVLTRLRSVPATRRVPVIVISAVSNSTLLQLPGVSGVIQKSRFSIVNLQTIVSDVLAEYQPVAM